VVCPERIERIPIALDAATNTSWAARGTILLTESWFLPIPCSPILLLNRTTHTRRHPAARFIGSWLGGSSGHDKLGTYSLVIRAPQGCGSECGGCARLSLDAPFEVGSVHSALVRIRTRVVRGSTTLHNFYPASTYFHFSISQLQLLPLFSSRSSSKSALLIAKHHRSHQQPSPR
jgi:hypothetical protein